MKNVWDEWNMHPAAFHGQTRNAIRLAKYIYGQSPKSPEEIKSCIENYLCENEGKKFHMKNLRIKLRKIEDENGHNNNISISLKTCHDILEFCRDSGRFSEIYT